MKKISNILFTLLFIIGAVLTVWSVSTIRSYINGYHYPFYKSPEYWYTRCAVGILLLLIWCTRVMIKHAANKRTESEKKRLIESRNELAKEFRLLSSIDYTQTITDSKIRTFSNVIENHIKKLFTTENTKKYQELSSWDKRKQELERLLLILDEHKEISQYINVAFQHFMQGRWNECSINLRKTIEWMILTKIDAEGTLFAGEQLPAMIELIEKYYDGKIAYDMKHIHRNGNKAAHTFASDNDVVDFETCNSDFHDMEHVILCYFEDETVQRYLSTPGKDVKIYFELINTLIIGEYYEDAAVNIRKTLELLVRSYLTKYQIRCLGDYQRDLCGYIDLLHFKNCISEESKNNMHKLRAITNEGAHMKSAKPHMNKENMLLCFDILKKEVDIYENIITG